MYSLGNYQKIIAAFLEAGYNFYPLGESCIEEDTKVALLRHDIDYSLQAALKIAEANHAMGVRACFCLQLRNVLYNLLEEGNQKVVQRIAGLGHTIGLHFSLPQEMENISGNPVDDRVETMILGDMQTLQTILDVDVQPVMSWHNPSVLGEECAALVSRPVSGLINAYALVAEGLKYFSDSNHRFSVEEWLTNKAWNSPDRVHLLFHPFQWVYNSNRMEEVLCGAWIDQIRTMETVFLTNHLYRGHFPEGMPEKGLDAWVKPLCKVADSGS